VKATRWWRIVAVMLTFSVLAAACGDDDEDTTAGSDTTAADDGGDTESESEDGGDEPAAGGEINMDEEVEIAEGTVLNLPDCPSDWDPMTGLTDDTIKIAMSLPESGPVAALGGLDDGMRAWFEGMEPIDGRTFELVSADDAYDPARTLSNTEEFLETDEPFAFTWMVGTPNVLAIRDLTQDECVPQLFNSTGFPDWGDPENYPWTIGGILNYKTESELWCNYIVDEIGEGTTVAGLFMDNDFGNVYEETIQACADEGQIDLVESVNHDPAAPDVTSQITTIAASGAEVVLLGTTGAACPQAMAALAGQTNFQPEVFLSYTCEGIPTYFKPIDPAGEGVLVASTSKSPSEVDDPDVAEAVKRLDAAGLDPNQGAFFTGTIFGRHVEAVFRNAAEMEGGLNRVNLMRAVWNGEWENNLQRQGTFKTDGINDAYLPEAAQFVRYVPPAAGEDLGTYEPVGDIVSLEGETGSVTKEGGE
jgi:ABC-type branched-subunit amino acid transport system substrate-binding protein